MSEYTVIEQTADYEIGVRPTSTGSEIVAACRCGDGGIWPNKGLGRAVMQAWRTQHQHGDDS